MLDLNADSRTGRVPAPGGILGRLCDFSRGCPALTTVCTVGYPNGASRFRFLLNDVRFVVGAQVMSQ